MPTDDQTLESRESGHAAAHVNPFLSHRERSALPAFVKISATSSYDIWPMSSSLPRYSSVLKSSGDKDRLPNWPPTTVLTIARVRSSCGGYTVEPDDAASPASSLPSPPF